MSRFSIYEEDVGKYSILVDAIPRMLNIETPKLKEFILGNMTIQLCTITERLFLSETIKLGKLL